MVRVTLFRKSKVSNLFDEFKTSCRYSKCEDICNKTIVRENPKPFIYGCI